MLAGCDMTAEDAMGCPGNEASATKQDIPKKAHAIVAEARGETGEPAARPAKRGLQRRQQSRCGFQVEAVAGRTAFGLHVQPEAHPGG